MSSQGKVERNEKVDKGVEEALDSGYLSTQISTEISEGFHSESIDKPKESGESTMASDKCKTVEEEFDSAYCESQNYSERIEEDLRKFKIEQPLIDEYFQPNDDGDTLLHLAIILPHPEAAKRLIQLAPDTSYLDRRNNYYQSPLDLAVLTNQPKFVRDLVLAGARPTIRDKYGNTPLHSACELSRVECAKQLLTPVTKDEISRKYGTAQFPQDLEIWNNEGETCVHAAARCNNTGMIKLLVEHGADINAREGKQGQTILHKACEEGNESMVSFLLRECKPYIQLEIETYGGKTAFEVAAYKEKVTRASKFARIIKGLVAHGAFVYSINIDEDLDEDDDEDESFAAKSFESQFCPLQVA